jgi:hypothetical protein
MLACLPAFPTCGLMTVFWQTSTTSHTRSVPSSEQVSAVVLSVGCQQPPVQLVTWPASRLSTGDQGSSRESRLAGSHHLLPICYACQK